MASPVGGSKWHEKTFWQGAGGAIVAAIIAAVIALIGILVGNTGVASPFLPGSPQVTVTAAGPTVTLTPQPGPTVTVTARPEGEDDPSVNPAEVHLADPDNRPDDILTSDSRVQSATGLAIAGERFATGWTAGFGSGARPDTVVGVNTNTEYSRFKGRIGLYSARNPSGDHPTRVQILTDGHEALNTTVHSTTGKDFDIAITKTVQVEIKVFPPDEGVYVAIGEPTLVH